MSQPLKMASPLASLQWPLGYFHLQPYWIQSKMNFYIPLQIRSLHQPQSHVLITKLHLSHCVHRMHIILQASDPHVTSANVKSSDICIIHFICTYCVIFVISTFDEYLYKWHTMRNSWTWYFSRLTWPFGNGTDETWVVLCSDFCTCRVSRVS